MKPDNQRWVLQKEGYEEIHVQKYYFNETNYKWYMRTSPAKGWNEEKWIELKFPEEEILDYIKNYGKDYYEQEESRKC